MPQIKGPTMKTGDRLFLSIEAVAFGGQGVGRYHDLVVFVPFTVDGDAGMIEVVEVKKRYALGKLHRLTTSSSWRVEPICNVYGRCGGCRYQHIAYAHQLRLKQQHVHDAFSRIGKFTRIPLADILPSPDPWHYRGKAELHIRRKPHQAAVVGFSQALSHEILDIESCAIVDPTINVLLGLLRQEVRTTGEAKIDRRAVLWSSAGHEAATRGNIPRMVKGKVLLIPPGGFFQANRLLAETLLDVVLEMSALTGGETVIDGYCGSGFFSVFLAPGAGRFYGIEFDASAVQAAETNLKNEGIDHALFYEGDVGHVLADAFVKTKEPVDVLVLDPPRAGLGPAVLSAITRLMPARIVYVSCNPATMARDIRFLADHNYILEALQPLDMFPQTSHIEIVGRLRHANKRSSADGRE